MQAMTWRAIQLVIALALPIGFVALAPDRSLLWALVIMAGEIAFAALNRGWTWLVPVAAALVLVQGFVDLGAAAQVVWWISLAVSVAVGVIALAFGRQGPDRSDDSRRVGLLVATALLATGLLTMGVVVGLTRTTDQAFEAGQQSAAESWVNASPQGEPDGTTPVIGAAPSGEANPSAATRVKAGAIAALEFTRPSTGERLVADRTFYIGDGVDDATLAKGPGRYPGTADPGAPGNIAIAGHRTGWGSPFLHLDDLRPGDEIRLTDSEGHSFTYVVDRSMVVEPDDAWVLDPDPLGNGRPTLTITTCDPPHTDENRLIVFAQ